MAVTEEGEFFFEERDLSGGIRQDLPPSKSRYRLLKNVHLLRKGVLTKRKGTKLISNTDITGTPELLSGFDAHYANDNQKVVLAAGSDAWIYNNTTKVFDAQSLSLTAGNTSMMMFGDELLLNNGTNFKQLNATGTWADAGGSPPIGTLLAPHANRAIVSGRSTTPHEFYYSAVRDSDSWDITNDKIGVGGLSGEAIKGLGTLGRWLLVGTEQNTWVYLQSTTNPGDWDFINLSETVGVVSHKSVFEVASKQVRMTLFWGLDGPMVAYQMGDEIGLKPLWNPIYQMVDGVSDTPLDGLNTGRFNQISGGFNAELNQACFGCPKTGLTENSAVLAYDLDSLVEYVTGQRDQPFVTVNDNGNSAVYPCDILMQVRVDDSTLLPSATGRNRMYGGRQGQLLRHEAPNTFKDDGDTPIPLWVVRDGFNGEEDGVAGFEKVAQKGRVEATQNGGFEVMLLVSADGDEESESQPLSLDGNLGLWGDGDSWTTDPALGKWNAATVKKARGDYGVHGVNFKMQVADYGSIANTFEMFELSLDGFIYERQ
jgi:hypothetical protein